MLDGIHIFPYLLQCIYTSHIQLLLTGNYCTLRILLFNIDFSLNKLMEKMHHYNVGTDVIDYGY